MRSLSDMNQTLINELKESPTDLLNLIEGVNQLTNQAFKDTKNILQEAYRMINPTDLSWPKTGPKTLYYPASGADICFPFLLFPTLETVYAFAMEEFGDVADMEKDRVDGKLPTKWHITGAPSEALEYSKPGRGSPNGGFDEKRITFDPDGWDDRGYYDSCRDSRICADLLFRIKHVLHGTILAVNKVNEFHHEIKFLLNGIERKFVYFQYKEENQEIFLENLMAIILSVKLDVLFLKGAHQLLAEDANFKSLCVEPFIRPGPALNNALVVSSPSAMANSLETIDHKIERSSLFQNVDETLIIYTEDKQERFAFGYLDCMYIGNSNNLRKSVLSKEEHDELSKYKKFQTEYANRSRLQLEAMIFSTLLLPSASSTSTASPSASEPLPVIYKHGRN